MKFIEETPWFICDRNDTNYCAYVDTDSNYFNAEPILKHLYPDFESFDDKKKDELLENVALKYQDIITDYYNSFAKECFNADEHRLEMKTECVIRTAYFRATRRYAQWITKEEGIKKDKLDIKGLEFQKANFPPLLGKFFHKALVDVLKGETQEEIDTRIKEFKKKIVDGTVPLSKLGNPTSVKQINKHQGKPAKAGEMFSKFKEVKNKADKKLGAPAAVKAAVRYNDLIRFWKLDGKHNLIAQGEKIKWIYLKPNPYQLEELAFLEYDMPEKIRIFLDEYADRGKIFDSILLNKLEGFYSDLEWNLNLNPYINQFFEV